MEDIKDNHPNLEQVVAIHCQIWINLDGSPSFLGGECVDSPVT